MLHVLKADPAFPLLICTSSFGNRISSQAVLPRLLIELLTEYELIKLLGRWANLAELEAVSKSQLFLEVAVGRAPPPIRRKVPTHRVTQVRLLAADLS